MKMSFIFLFVIILFTACKENDNIIGYDTDNSYVYFAYPNPDTRVKERFLDSINYNFALDEYLTITQKKIAIPIRIGGNAVSYDRNYVFKVDPSSNYNPALITLSSPVIAANKYVDTLYITIARGADLLEEKQELILSIEANDAFGVGHYYNKTLRITFSDIVTEPSWWNLFRTVLQRSSSEMDANLLSRRRSKSTFNRWYTWPGILLEQYALQFNYYLVSYYPYVYRCVKEIF
jgi:hypothetical protein